MSNNSSNSQSHHPNKTRRLIVGFLLLLIVDVLWVASSELTRWLFKDEKFSKAFLSTYLKTCLFTIYLLGFLFHRPWRDQCLRGNDSVTENGDHELDELNCDPNLSEPHYEPLRRSSDCDSDKSSIVSVSDNETREEVSPKKSRIVRFSGVNEVRRLPEGEAEAALLARLPFEVWLRKFKFVQQYHDKLPIKKVAKLALQFCFIWFIGNLAYQEALRFTEPGVANLLSSTSSLFTLIFAAIFPSCSNDKFTLSKLCVVACSISGVCIVTWVDKGKIEVGALPRGAIWSLVGSIFYAFYLVLLRRRVDSEDKLDIPMFFGFVGLFCLVLLWPAMYLLHVSNLEPFYPLPTQQELLYIIVNGILGTVLSEYLWLWGCFLTSSLVATMSLSMTVPLTVLADSLLHRTEYSLGFYLGATPIVLSFVFASLLVHYDNWDPVYIGLRRLCHRVFYFPMSLLRRICSLRSSSKNVVNLNSDETEGLLLDSV